MTKETKKQVKHAYDLKVGQSYILSDGFDHDLVKLVRDDNIGYYSPELITTYVDQSYYFDGVKMSVPEFDNLYQLFNYCKKQGYKIYET
ncbi:hypothetical protein [Lactobacillus crispatus]|uniref:hypothetical protein n=1 Tax=Lactobacillus crispatus TaxID=47770 RepID=UPI0021A5BB28|nr:hypothetical protein [Lactobacillus crispatus]MCT3539742.1 hypothetical protein [Lactobacillus crispatus]